MADTLSHGVWTLNVTLTTVTILFLLYYDNILCLSFSRSLLILVVFHFTSSFFNMIDTVLSSFSALFLSILFRFFRFVLFFFSISMKFFASTNHIKETRNIYIRTDKWLLDVTQNFHLMKYDPNMKQTKKKHKISLLCFSAYTVHTVHRA